MVFFEAWKRTKFETFAHYEILNRTGFDSERIGGWEKAKIAEEIFSQMRKEKNVSETRYLELFTEKLTSSGYI